MARRGVFKIINKKTGKVYVGSSNTNMDRLIYSYWQRLYSGDHHNNDLQSDFDHYGRSNFTVEIVSDLCYSEGEVRSLREHIIFENRFNTYNEDVPVHYDGGGNPNGSFGGYHKPQHNIIDDLIGIIDKSNLNYSYKNTLKSDVKNGDITNKTELDKKINYYQELPQLLKILNKSNLKALEKDEIESNIKNGSITNKNQLEDVITHYKTVERLLKILNKSDLKQSYKDEIIPDIKSGTINNENQLNNKIHFYKQLPALLSILDNSNIKVEYKNILRTDIRKGSITSKSQLKDEIRAYGIMGKYDNITLKKLCKQYCAYSTYHTWTQERDKIKFKSENIAQKVIGIESLEKEINSLKHDILHSQPFISKPELKVFELTKIICDALSFNSYELLNKNKVIFDNKYKLEIKKLEDIYEELDLTKDNKFKTTDKTINNCLNETKYGDNFSNTAKNIITEYCEIKKIPFWDLINQEDTILLYDDYITISSVQDCIEALDDFYKEFNLKLAPLNLKNIYHVFKRFRNKPSDGETESVKRLLSILSESNLPITTKIEVKDDINKGNIYSEDSLNDKIKSLMKNKYKTSRRKIIRTSANTDSKEYYEHNKTGTENKSSNEKTNETDNPLEKLYEIHGYYFCPTCGKKIPNIIKTCDECSKKQNSEDKKTNSQKTPENPKDTLEKLNEIFGYHFCPTCGKKIPNIMETCDECSKSNK